MRRFLVLIFVALLSGASSASGQIARCDRQCVATVKDQLKGQRLGLYTSWGEKENRRMGDSVAVGIQKIFPKRSVLSPKNIKLYLPIIDEAFQDKQMIDKPENRAPTATLKLLNRLRDTVKDPLLREAIERTITTVLS